MVAKSHKLYRKKHLTMSKNGLIDFIEDNIMIKEHTSIEE